MAKFKQITEIPIDGEWHTLGYMTKGIRHDDGSWAIMHYKAVIIACTGTIITLDCGGYRSDTTKDRLNLYLKNMGVHVFKEDKLWRIKVNGVKLYYRDKMKFVHDMIDYTDCEVGSELISKRNKLLKYLESEIKQYEILPDKYVYDICRALNYPNVNLAVESLDHKDILKAFKKLCFTRLPDVKDIVLK